MPHPRERLPRSGAGILRAREARCSTVMEVLYERCAGLDVHKQTVKVCLITPGIDQRPVKEIRTSGTKTQDLLELRDWLKAQGCTHLAMESTGAYWRPVFNLLEGDFERLVVNAHHLKTVPGRKTDVKDAEWIADLRHAWAPPGQLHPLGSEA
jgi:transposase